MKTIFITGASSGLGKASAQLFADKGWTVLASMRQPENEKELSKHSTIHLMQLDVTDSEGVIHCVQEAVKNFDIDVVFNNAGYGLAGPFEGADEGQIFRNINTNLLGVMRVTQAFLPHFRNKKSGLFINTTSIGGSITLPLNSVYHATKFALEGWSESLAFELEPFGITVKTIAPGGILTDFAGRSIVMTEHTAYEVIAAKVTGVLRNPERRQSYSSAEQIAEVVYEAATDGKKTLKYIAGADAKGYYDLRNKLGQEEFRKEVKKIFFG